MSAEGLALEAELARRFVLARVSVACGADTVELLKPRSAEELIVEEDFARDERMPYWAELWPSAVVLASAVASRRASGVSALATGGGRSDVGMRQADGPGRALELGCGLGLVTVAAMRAGWDVLATDWYEDALRFTAVNALHAVGRAPATRLVDWFRLPADLGRFDLLLAADVLYEARYASVVAAVLSRTLAPRGSAWVADPGRAACHDFLRRAAELGLHVRDTQVRPFDGGGHRQQITVYALMRRSAPSRRRSAVARGAR